MLTRMPFGPSSPTAAFDTASRADLVEAYAAVRSSGANDEIDTMLMIEPRPSSAMCDARVCMPRNTPIWLTSIKWR